MAAETRTPPCSVNRLLSFVLFASMGAFWIIYLAGLGRAQDACVQARRNAGGRRLASAVEDCGNEFSLQWWVLFFGLFCIIGAVALACNFAWMVRFRTPLLLMFAMQTTLLMGVASSFVIPAHRAGSADDAGTQGTKAAAAGTVALCVLNFIYLIAATEETGSLRPTLFDTAPVFRGSKHTAGSSEGAVAKGSEVATVGATNLEVVQQQDAGAVDVERGAADQPKGAPAAAEYSMPAGVVPPSPNTTY